MRRFFLPLGLTAALSGPFLPAGAQPLPVPLPVPTAASPVAEAEPSGPLTLDAALALAAAGNFTLAAAGREVEANDGAVMQARTFRNPEFAALVEDVRPSTRATTGQFNIPLEIGGKRPARIAAAERGREVAQAELGSLRADLRASVIAGFFAVMVAQERVKLASGSVDIAAGGVRVASRRVAAGKVPPLEETRARVEQANAELELAEATAELQSSRLALSALWGNAAPRFTEAQGDLDALPSRPGPEALRTALDGSPLLLAQQQEEGRRAALVDVERSRRYPDVTLSVGAKRDNDANRNMAVLGVAVPLPLFDRNQGNLYEAMRRADKARDETLATRIRLASELQQASGQLAVSRAAAQTLKDTVLPAAQQAYEAASKGFEAGKFGFLDVLDAQRTLFQARIRYLGVLARTYQSATTIDRILGR